MWHNLREALTVKRKMRKLLLSAAFLSLTLASAQAQLTVHSFSGASWTDEYGEEILAAGPFNHVSANGQYAVGCDDQDLMASNGNAFLWRRSNPSELEFINTTSNRVTACDVTNDGTIFGSFEERDPETDDQAVCYPGYKPLDGDWKALPVPSNMSISYATYNESYINGVRAVTPDGKYAAGTLYIKVGHNSTWGWDIVYDMPIIWEQVDGEYQIADSCLNLGDAGKSYTLKDGEWALQEGAQNYKIFIVWDISNDGRTIVGVNTADCGAQNPAFIRDGVLYQLFNCDDYSTDEGLPENFNGGICNSIDANGNIYGYFQDGETNTKYFEYTADGQLVWLDSWIVCADKDGNQYSSSAAGVTYALDCSEDGQVIVGEGLGSLGFGSYGYPMLASNDTPSGISAQRNIEKVSLNYQGGNNLYVNGLYSNATLYNTAGQQLQSIGQGSTFNMNQLPKGTYIVNVATQSGKQSFKIMK